MFFIGDQPNPMNCDFVFLALHDTTLIGVFTIKEPGVFIFDTEGNSILNSTSRLFTLPGWVVKSKTRISSADRTVYNVLDKIYNEIMQADDGELEEKTIREFQRFKTDTSLANRHIALLFDTYQNIISETAAKGIKPPANICVPLMKQLADECALVYNSIPAIVCIYLGEAPMSAGILLETFGTHHAD